LHHDVHGFCVWRTLLGQPFDYLEKVYAELEEFWGDESSEEVGADTENSRVWSTRLEIASASEATVGG
jgi:hypothetical protein